MGGPPNVKLKFRFFVTNSGTEPVRDWLLELDAEAMKTVGRDMFDVQLRWPVSKPLVDGLGGGLFEVRTTSHGNEYRVLFCIVSSAMVALVGFAKKTQQTPKRFIDLARRRMAEAEAQ